MARQEIAENKIHSHQQIYGYSFKLTNAWDELKRPRNSM
jgi:hypothetical protein